MDDYTMLEKGKTIVKKYMLKILLSGIFFATLFCGYKEYKGNYVIQSGDILIGRQIQLQNYTDRLDHIHYDQLNSSGTILYDFYIESQSKFDYDKLAPGWNNKSDFQKIEWLKKHIRVKDYGAGNLEVRFDFMKSEPKNLRYIQVNGGNYIDAYLKFLKGKKVLQEYSVKSEMNVFPKSEIINKKGVLLKYGIIGFTLGSILFFTILYVKELLK